MQRFTDFLKSASGIASSISTIIGLLTLILWKPVKKIFLNRKEEKKKKADEEAAFRKSMLDFANSANMRMTQIEDSIDANEKDRIRREMFTFAAECRRGEQHTLDEFRHIISIKEKYDALLKKSGDKNGVFSAEYDFIMDIFAECQRKNNFLV